ncbi:hypothetical protein ACR6C2_28590 [Streptomyces sp. INA 01156]
MTRVTTASAASVSGRWSTASSSWSATTAPTRGAACRAADAVQDLTGGTNGPRAPIQWIGALGRHGAERRESVRSGA